MLKTSRSKTLRLRPSIQLLGILLLTILSTSQYVAAQATSKNKPLNVIFLLVDDLGWTDFGCFGSDLYQTPNIDRLASRGLRFTNGYAACTVCSPTRAAAMTGMYPGRLHVTDFITGGNNPKAKLRIPDWTQRLEHQHVSLAEAFQQAKYRTIHIGKWHLMPRGTPEMNDYLPQRHGFDVNIGGNEWGAPGSYFFPYSSRRRNVGVLPPGGKKGDYLTDRLTDEALKQLEANQENPFLLYFPYYNVHTPLQGKPELVAKYQARVKPTLKHQHAVYASMVQSVDESVGRIVKKLESLKIADRTMIVLTGDNGGLDRGGKPTDNAPLRAGKGSAYEGGVRVPLIVHWPGVTPVGHVSHQPVITCDFYPTFLEATGVAGNAAHNAGMDGISLVPLLKDPQHQLKRDALYWHYPHYHSGGATPHSAMRAGDWKLIEFFEDNRVELYHLKDDISESRNLAQEKPERAQQLRAQLQRWRRDVGAQLPTPNPNYDPQQSKRKPKRP